MGDEHLRCWNAFDVCRLTTHGCAMRSPTLGWRHMAYIDPSMSCLKHMTQEEVLTRRHPTVTYRVRCADLLAQNVSSLSLLLLPWLFVVQTAIFCRVELGYIYVNSRMYCIDPATILTYLLGTLVITVIDRARDELLAVYVLEIRIIIIVCMPVILCCG